MRPLIEILEDERTLTQKLESVYRYLLRTDDSETLNILNGQRKRIMHDLDKNRNELREYLTVLLEGADNHER